VTDTLAIPNISNLLDAHLLAKRDMEGERKVAGGMTWRASKLGNCLRQQYLQFHLKRQPLHKDSALSLRRFEVGHQWNHQFAEWFADLGFDVYQEEEFSDSTLDIGGHADFTLINDEVKFGVELKSVNSKWFWYRTKEKETTASPEHMMQAAVYEILTGREYPWVVLTVSKDDLTMQQDVVTEEHCALALERLKILDQAKAIGIPPPCTCKDDWEWKFCPYYAGDEKAARAKGAKPQGECCVI